jgi:hypothetical protein
MMPMQMCRKSRTMQKVENLSRTATSQNLLQHGGTNQITLARSVEFSPEPVGPCSSTFCRLAPAKRVPGAAAESALFALGRPPGQPRQVSVPDVAQRQNRSGAGLAGYESFRRRIDEYCANPAGVF